MPDRSVIVVGGGAAGVWAAASARRAGASVKLFRRAPGASAVSSGCIDLASTIDLNGQSATPELVAHSLARTEKAHPFAALGTGLGVAIERARSLLTSAHPKLGFRGANGRNLLLATPMGTLKETWLAQGSIARGDLLAWPKDARLGIVAVPNRVAFDADAVASGLRSRGHDAVALAIDFPLDRFAALPELAKLLDQPEPRAKFVTAVVEAARKAGVTHLLLPTAGMDDPNSVLDALKAQGIEAAELPGSPPSVPGLRFDRDLERLAQESAEIVHGDFHGKTDEADAFILATGRFFGGGIRHEGSFRETVFNLPVFVNGADVADKWLGDLLDRNASAIQTALKAGLMVNASMQPVDDHGRVVIANIYAAGSVIGGYDPAKEGGGLGVCAVTAVVAGGNAASSEFASTARPSSAHPEPRPTGASRRAAGTGAEATHGVGNSDLPFDTFAPRTAQGERREQNRDNLPAFQESRS